MKNKKRDQQQDKKEIGKKGGSQGKILFSKNISHKLSDSVMTTQL